MTGLSVTGDCSEKLANGALEGMVMVGRPLLVRMSRYAAPPEDEASDSAEESLAPVEVVVLDRPRCIGRRVLAACCESLKAP